MSSSLENTKNELIKWINTLDDFNTIQQINDLKKSIEYTSLKNSENVMTKKEWQILHDELKRYHKDFLKDYKNSVNLWANSISRNKSIKLVQLAITRTLPCLTAKSEILELLDGYKDSKEFSEPIDFYAFIEPKTYDKCMKQFLSRIKLKIISLDQ
ncbi:hypothetical protein [Flavicella sediminum]|uniref:hypothetical protein n=1 Tax=Flavicella sediminum TaxID=2585141 RepID=UPI00111ECC4E|nr:hypothetical protein [Flavicella sediminum]